MGSESLLLMQQPFQQLVELSSLVQVASQASGLPEEWVACGHQDQLEPVLVVDLAVVAGNPVVLAGSHHSRGTVQEETLARVQETSQVAVDHMALGENRLDPEDHRDPIHQEDLGGRTVVDIVGDDRKEVLLGAKGLVAEGQVEDLVVDVAEEVGLELGDEIRSVCNK